MTSIDNFIKCPKGTKQWLLFLGYMEADAAFFLRGANISTRSNPNPQSERRKLIQYGVLIEHPKEGLILWETGSGENVPEVFGPQLNDVFAQIEHDPSYGLEQQIEKTGHKLSDIKLVILGHLHLDHAGGIINFFEKQIPVLAHELEIKNAFYSIATKQDLGVYFPKFISYDANWQTWRGDVYEVAQGITLRHMPGHTPGTCILQVNLEESGTWIHTSDMYLVKENYTENHAQGFLSRDHDDWCHSNDKIHNLVKNTDAKIIFGHDLETFEQFKPAPHVYQ